MEPIFAVSYHRKILDQAGIPRDFLLTDYALGLWKAGAGKDLPNGFVTAADFPAHIHFDMQAILQLFVDKSISKTINVPENYPFEDFKRICNLAYDMGLKG